MSEEKTPLSERQARAWIYGLVVQAQTGGALLEPVDIAEAAGIMIAYAVDRVCEEHRAAGKSETVIAALREELRVAFSGRCHVTAQIWLAKSEAHVREQQSKADDIAGGLLAKMGVSCGSKD